MQEKTKLTYSSLKSLINLDDLHFNFRQVDGYRKPFVFIVCEREAGKSVAIWTKAYSTFKKYGRPSLVLRRNIVDITATYIDDVAKLLNKFLPEDGQIELKYKKGDIKQGIIDVYLNDKIFFRVVALSNPLSRIKSLVLRHVAYIFFDEFICNTDMGEKYLTREPFRVEEIYTTYNRESDNGIICYFCGNPYSLFNPYFTWLSIPWQKLHPDTIISGDAYVINCYKIKDELKQQLLKHNPLYKFDESYKKYAFDGEAVNDQYINIVTAQPRNFVLMFAIKTTNNYLGIYHFIWPNAELKEKPDFMWWVRKIDRENIGSKKIIYAFNLNEMDNRSIMVSHPEYSQLEPIKDAIRYQNIAYATLDCKYLLEETLI